MEIILAGRPNSGKSTLFNQLAGTNQKVANYAGCTVEKKTAEVRWEDTVFSVTDLPGIYSLQANSLDEEVALNHLKEVQSSGFVVFVIDGNNLEQEITLPLLLKKKGYRIAIAVNMMDEVRANKKILDLAGMQDLVDIPFFPIAAKTGEGLPQLKKFLAIDQKKIRASLVSDDSDPLGSFREIKQKSKILGKMAKGPEEDLLLKRDTSFDRILLHKAAGPLIFLAVMFVVFQSIFSWASPVSDLLESGIGFMQDLTKATVANEFLASLLSDGVLAGVGAVIVFVPQIAILFFLIGLLEYSGYLPRIAYMVDRLMKPYGLDGKVFIPLLSSVACAVPGIMATRTIESERTRIMAIMISPLMTCSARLPVYTLLISSFVPATAIGPFQLQGLVMFSMFLVAIIMALMVAFVMHKLNFQKRKHVLDFIHLPHYRSPNWKELTHFVWQKVSSFLKKAGTIIAGMAILLWVLLAFPNSHEKQAELTEKLESPSISEEQKTILEQEYKALQLKESYAGQLGQWMEPVFQPLGYDWKLTIGILASLAAREVFVSTIGTVFALGEVDENSESLSAVLQNTKKADGTPAYTLATCLSLLVFFAFSLQCISTIGVAKRETNSWKIPAIMFTYMFLIAYGSAFVVYRVAGHFLS